MALSSLLDIITRVADELSLDRPSAVVAATAQQTRTLFACAQDAGRSLLRAHEWGALQTVGTITTVNGTASYALASNYDRMVPDTGWNRTGDTMLQGPDSPQVDRYLQESGVAQTSTRQRFRLKGSNVTIWPTPTSAETLVYEYVSNKWALSSGGTAQIEFLADTDTSYFDPNLMKAEIKWRFIKARGLDAQALYKEAEELREQRIASDIGGAKLSMAPSPSSQFVELDNLADGNWSL